MLVEDCLKASMRKIGVYAAGEPPEPEELQNALSALQSMFRTWASKRLLVFASTKEDFNTIAGTYLYTWGVGGIVNSARPNGILGATIRDSEGVDHPVGIITESDYRRIIVKSVVSRPYCLLFHPSYPLAEVTLYPIPQESEVCTIESFKPFTETSSFASLTDILVFPSGYEEATIFNLAIRLAPEYGKSVSAEVAAIAVSSYNSIITLNSANQVESIQIVIPAGRPYAGYSINTDSYK